MRIGELGASDQDEFMRLNDRLLWTFTQDDFQTMLACGSLFGHLTQAGALVTCAGVFPYEEVAVSIGAVMVSPDRQRRGLGKALMDYVHGLPCLAHRVLMLVATDDGIPLYKKCGYATLGHLRKMVRPTPLPDMAGRGEGVIIRTAYPSDEASILSLDRAAAGEGRSALVKARWAQCYRSAVALNSADKPVGYAFGTDQRGQLIIGPVAAPDVATVLQLIQFLSIQHQGQIRIDVPEQKQALSEALGAYGFEQQTNPPIMIRNGERLPSYKKTMWGIAAQALG